MGPLGSLSIMQIALTIGLCVSISATTDSSRSCETAIQQAHCFTASPIERILWSDSNDFASTLDDREIPIVLTGTQFTSASAVAAKWTPEHIMANIPRQELIGVKRYPPSTDAVPFPSDKPMRRVPGGSPWATHYFQSCL